MSTSRVVTDGQVQTKGMRMLKKQQRNALFNSMVREGLDPAECDLTEGRNWIGAKHRPTGSSLTCESDNRGSYKVWKEIPGEYNELLRDKNWIGVVKSMRTWADDVKQFMDTPDPWAELRREREVLSGAEYETMSNAPFTPDEQSRISNQLHEIAHYLIERYSPSGEQLSQIEARVDQIEEATHHIGRKDWLLMFYGVMFTLIVTVLVPPDAVQHVIATVLHGLGDLFGVGGTPPALPPVA